MKRALISVLDLIRSKLESRDRYELLYREMITGYGVHRMVFDSTGEPKDYIFLEVNPAFERLTGLRRGQVIGRSVTSVIPNIEKVWIERYGHVVKTGISDCFEAYSAALDKHYMAVAFRLKGDEFGVTFYETSSVHLLQSELMRAYDQTLQGWGKALDMRDHETEGHSERVALRTVWLAKKAGIVDSEILKDINRGALLHDIGKIGVPDSVLLKPGPLNKEERQLIEQHPILAKSFLDPISYLKNCVDIPYCHHERWDGLGYPRRLKGELIPLSARLFSIIDVLDALTHDRPYRKSMPFEDAVRTLEEGRHTHFDPRCLDLFMNNYKEIEE